MRAKIGIMMGYAQRTKGYRIWLIDENKLVETINKDNTESQDFQICQSNKKLFMVEVTIPNCYKQAIRSRDASKWRDAMDKEINVMMERKVWDLVDHPDNIKILENRWAYTIKYDENKKIVRYKARLVARGNTQLRGDLDSSGNQALQSNLSTPTGSTSRFSIPTMCDATSLSHFCNQSLYLGCAGYMDKYIFQASVVGLCNPASSVCLH
ncbi:retrovirus-related Pol polyprotein from transposon TNT 1-94 [Trichonephila clavipes]|nr:retrovirus-related Pol polyprotein from transposon TNT 1-94 [Trichonephila clavipes]